ncbi:MAG: hypothetical protein HY881_05760 [Deltaproteobacteria bacterium]|nr:hypothetical protein [Deltaproteobacteria bacterium]
MRSIKNPTENTAEFKLFLVLFIVLAIFVLFPLLNTGFTTSDDLEICLQAFYPENFFEYALNLSTGQGRLPSFFLQYLYWLPYIFHSDAVYQCFRLLPILLNTLLFAVVVTRFLGLNHLGYLSVILYLTFLQNNWQHCLLTSYPLVFQFGLCCFFLSLLSFHRYVVTGRKQWAVICGILYLFALITSEIFTPYFLIFLCIALVFQKTQTVPSPFFRLVFLTFPVILPLMIYLVCYLLFRWVYPSGYSGTQFAEFSIYKLIRVIVQLSVGTLPGIFYLVDSGTINATFDGFGYHRVDLFFLIAHLKADWIVKAFLSSTYCTWLLGRQANILPIKTAVVAILIGLLFTIIPFIPLGLTEKYFKWILNGTLSYVYSHASFFGTILILSIILFQYRNLGNGNKIIRIISILLIGLVIATASLLTDYYNYYVVIDQQLSHLKWKTMDRFFETAEFDKIPQNSILVAPSLWKNRGIVSPNTTYWSRYLLAKTGKKVIVIQNEAQLIENYNTNDHPPIYFLKFIQEQKSPNQMLLLAQIDTIMEKKAKEIILYSLSRYKEFTVIGHYSQDIVEPAIHVNGRKLTRKELSIEKFSALVVFPDTLKESIPSDLSRKSFLDLVGTAVGRIITHSNNSGISSTDFYKIDIRSTVGIELDTIIISYFQD